MFHFWAWNSKSMIQNIHYKEWNRFCADIWFNHFAWSLCTCSCKYTVLLFHSDFMKTYDGLSLETDTGTKFNNSTTNEQSIPTEQCTANIPEFQSGSQTPCSKLLPGYDWKLLTIYITTNNLTLLKFRFWLV